MKDAARALPGQPPVAEKPGAAAEPAGQPTADGGPPSRELAAAAPAGRLAPARSLLRRCWPPALIIVAGLACGS